MRILIIGMGYAGNRYRRAFLQLRAESGPIDIAYVSRTLKPHPEPGYTDLGLAMSEFAPHLVVVTVNDVHRAQVLADLASYQGVIVCEKPLVTAEDDLEAVVDRFGDRDDFFVAQIERYSHAARDLKAFVRTNGLRVVRGSFFWAKNRIGDPRPTSGVISEIIHPIDLLQWMVTDGQGTLGEVSSQVIRSDFSISGDTVIDTALVTGRIGEVPISGFSSFVGLERMRSIQLVLSDDTPSLIYATATFDSPVWDADHAHVWTLTERGEQNEVLRQNYPPEEKSETTGLRKQILLCRDLLARLQDPAHRPDLPGITEALRTQGVLNDLARGTGPTTRYFIDTERFRLASDASAEVLG